MEGILYLYVPIGNEYDGRESSYSEQPPSDSMIAECAADQARLFMLEDGVFSEYMPQEADWEEIPQLHR